ncbi:AraC family transcriptional regulator [Novosphingobium album (ex Liu et al. 2023)]|uniref:Helix-turn-helix transcriptional regulator n=1 Tax=Novosphingobium album (ex Liu et al. 2023) TaxID=3031130 RepID=A0ABT5WKT5_9SPHN|nr:helix-turn-helix transcriptional regulator [Novosphingobium album (ex Liu et al. 2023)]MDE8650641.1 helix-turn-helix transcriptional regulator [Novosphingobium album (ex Liu et al. 2023)]
MYNNSQTLDWEPVAAPPDAKPPAPMTMRAQSLAARSYFPEHAHDWGQLVYAISGVLTVAIAGRSFVISPDQAVWLPAGVAHRVGSLAGAQFRSLWIAQDVSAGLPVEPIVHAVGPLLKALIVEIVDLQSDGDGYTGRVTQLILDQLRRAAPIPAALPWPRGEALAELCAALYADPADPRSAEQWARALGMSPRTLARRFETEVGICLRSWRRRMRLFKAVELLGGGMDVTGVALELGYGSPSAFIYAFRTEMGASPQAYMNGKSADY